MNGPSLLSVVDSSFTHQHVRCTACHGGAVSISLASAGSSSADQVMRASFARVRFEHNSNRAANDTAAPSNAPQNYAGPVDTTDEAADCGLSERLHPLTRCRLAGRLVLCSCLSINSLIQPGSESIMFNAAQVEVTNCSFAHSQSGSVTRANAL